MPDQFEQLKQKYQPVLTKIQQEGAELQNVNMDGNQLFVKAQLQFQKPAKTASGMRSKRSIQTSPT